ncbi:AAA family ATPase [Pseudomonas otitidis]|uniref:AAA family ATPase n=1 Tax=Metapseudomonas otitidis TaxID=319939 RepID=UPI00244CDEC7|nr:AAA family ATPase [Pseudomonas otitidis]MDH1105524.1 AAA family ATPase [Pseudomonas otitidis]MDH1161707.1 AAA family ATPase [Pseudomonas otitidis]MDH1162568.1 AAA family ATPase [Pseudomonas otitidis]
MLIRALQISIKCHDQDFGFKTFFEKGLNIIRGSNSSGKSTIINSLLYSLGMEELVGAKSERTLQYSVRDYVEYEGSKHFIVESSVSIEIENRSGNIVTITRPIKSQHQNTKLAKITQGPVLTQNFSGPSQFKFVHDQYSAIYEEGFFTFLEKFLGLNLPTVYDSNGKKVKLYLQAIFAALAVEQKRGWTDYIANIPFYSVRDARIKVVEYLLGTDVFEQEAKKAELDKESEIISNEWSSLAKKITAQASGLGLKLDGLSSKIPIPFEPNKLELNKIIEGKTYTIQYYVENLKNQHKKLEIKGNEFKDGTSNKTIEDIAQKTEEIASLTNSYEKAVSNLAIQKATLASLSIMAKQAQDELTSNQTAQKLRNYGAEIGLSISSDSCPTCHQHIEDSLTNLSEVGSKMDIETNIRYLQSQATMLSRQEAGLKQTIQDAELAVSEYGARLERARSVLNSLRNDATKGTTLSRAIIKQQLFIELEIEKFQKFNEEFLSTLKEFSSLSDKLKDNQSKRKSLPTEHYSSEDKRKISIFEKMFRANAGAFDYLSADISDIEFNYVNLLPYLAKIELREIIDSPAEQKRKDQLVKNGSMAHNSSASDFVRLIWSYILALYQTSSYPTVKGNHPGIIILDEPGQHSMATKSQQALFKMLSSAPGLQSIVAASFDDYEAVFKESTDGVKFKYIQLGEKCITPSKSTETD